MIREKTFWVACFLSLCVLCIGEASDVVCVVWN